MKTAVVVGAGLGGLALAIRLQHDGHRVTVVEKNSWPGGRCGTLDVEGFHFDTGPTLLLMPDVLERLFTDVGKRLSDYLDLRRLDPNYRLHFRDGSSFDFSSKPAEMAETLEAIEPGGGAAFQRFLDEAGFCYSTARENFVERNFTSPTQFLTLKNLSLLFKMRAHKKLYASIGRHFKDERLLQAFSFQTMYLGLSPYQSPALYTLLPYTELTEGIFYPMGGMHAIAAALEKLFIELGGSMLYNAPVSAIRTEGASATGVTIDDGRQIDAELVIANADLPYAVENLLPKRRTRKWKFTSSGYLLHLGLNKRFDEMPHHSIVFSGDYAKNFQEIFVDKTVPEDPAFYICRPSATDPSVAPPGGDVLYFLAPTPHLGGDADWAKEGPLLRRRMLDRTRELGYEGIEESIVVERSWTPVDFQEKLNLAAGCAFGLSHDILQVGWFRPHNRHREWSNLYFVGASTHPGTGIPMVLFSAELVQQRIAQEWQ